MDIIEKIDELITEGYKFKDALMLYNSSMWSYYVVPEEQKQSLTSWEAKIERLVKQNFHSEITNIGNILRDSCLKSQIKRLLGLLEALRDMPEENKPEPPHSQSLVSISNENNNSQSNKQEVNINASIIIEALKNELGGRHLKELGKVITDCEADGASEETKRSKVLDKIKSFGSDVAANIMTSIITNPNVWAGLL